MAETGEFPEGLDVGETGIRLAQDEPFAVINALFGVSLVHLHRGDLEQAVARLEQALGLCRFWQIPIRSGLGHLAARVRVRALRSPRRGGPLLAEAVDLSKGRWGGSQRMAWLAETHLLAGRPDEAGTLARQALELARAQQGAGVRGMGSAAPRRDRRAADTTRTVPMAEMQYGAAMALASELGMRPLVAHCHLGLGKLYRRTGDRAKAEAHLTTATAMYREMDMGFWLEKADAEPRGVDR